MEMKLYCFRVGAIKLPELEDALPIYAYLIEHPKGRILVDTGESYELRDENAIMTSEDTILPQLARIGYAPEDIDYVVISHMHLDHAGYMGSFPDATFIVRKEELRAAWWPEPYEQGYLLATYEKTRDFKYIQLEIDEDYDVFMDGRIVLIDTRGHSRGHQSVVLDLPNTGKVVLAIDAAPDQEILDRGFSGRPCVDTAREARSLRRLGHLAASGYQLFFAHDPKHPHGKLAPLYYD